MTRIIFSLVLLFAVNAHSQKRLDISLEGYINNFTNKKKIFGATMYMFQDGKMLSKSLSDSKGTYFISGSITTVLPFEILVSKPGYVSKKVLFDFEKLKVRNPNGTLQAMELLIIELFEVREGAVLDFAKDTYAEKFSWDPAMNLAVPEEKYKKDIEDEVLNAYSLADQGSKADLFKTKLTAALKRKDYEVAVTTIDSALIYEPNNTSLAKRKIEFEALIEKIKKDEDVEIIAGGNYDNSKGYFIEPTVVVTSNPNYDTMNRELFGPLVTIYIYPDNDWENTLKLIDKTSDYALTGAVYSQDRYALEEALIALENSAGNFYINDKPTGAVVAQQPFGGARASGTNDKAGGPLNLLRWISPRSVKRTLDTPQDWTYSFMQPDEN